VPEVRYITADDATYTVTGVVGESVMKTAQDNDVPGIVAECGGACACATCHVHVQPGFEGVLPPVGELEDEMLEGTVAERTDDSRLSCQLKVTDQLDGLTVRIPTEQQ